MDGPNSPGEGEPVNHAATKGFVGTSIHPSASKPTFMKLLDDTRIAGITIFTGED